MRSDGVCIAALSFNLGSCSTVRLKFSLMSLRRSPLLNMLRPSFDVL